VPLAQVAMVVAALLAPSGKPLAVRVSYPSAEWVRISSNLELQPVGMLNLETAKAADKLSEGMKNFALTVLEIPGVERAVFERYTVSMCVASFRAPKDVGRELLRIIGTKLDRNIQVQVDDDPPAASAETAAEPHNEETDEEELEHDSDAEGESKAAGEPATRAEAPLP